MSEDQATLFPGGPTLEQVEEWKANYGDIYMTEFEEGEVYIWRTLTRSEYKTILQIRNADPAYREERICERAVLWPEDYGHQAMSAGKAGVPTVLSEKIMEKSGFLPSEEAKKL